MSVDVDEQLGRPPAREATGSPPAALSAPAQSPADTDRPRQIGARTFDEKMSVVGAFVAAFATDWILYEHVLPFSGIVGFFVCWYVFFIGFYAGVTALANPRPVVIDRIASAVVHGAALLVGLALLTTIVYVFLKGFPAYRHMNFFTRDMTAVGPQAPLNRGGIKHALVGSVIIVSIAVAISLPLGLITAVFMNEVPGRLTNIVRTVVEAMTALPDLVAGLFIYAVLLVGLGFQRTGLAVALALSITMLPIIARSSEVALRVVPGGLREASLALGATHLRTVWRVVLPTARSGLGTALILGIARGIGETAPVLIVSVPTSFFNANPFSGAMESLPLFTYVAVRSGEPLYETRAYAAASVLLFVVLMFFVIVRLLSRSNTARR
jgi:phosphate transport system permease protein